MREFPPEAVADACGIEAGEIRRMARELAARRAGGGLRAHRHLHAGVRHARELARRRAERAHRQPRPRGRRDVHARGRGPAELARRRRQRARRALRPLGRAACAACPSSSASCPCRRSRRRSTRPGEGQVRALITVAGQPARLDSEQRAPRERGRGPRLHALDRHLRERDDAARGRDPARAGAAREVALRRGALPARRAQRRQLLAARVRARGPRRVGGLHAARRDRRRPGPERRRRRASTTW